MKEKKSYKNFLWLTALFGSFNFLSANAIEKSNFMRGFFRLIKDLGSVLIALSLVIGGTVVVYQMIKVSIAEDDSSAKEAKNRARTAFIFTVLATVAIPILTVVLSYFK